MKFFIKIILLGLLSVQIVAIFHAYKFTHFSNKGIIKTKSPEKLNTITKIQALIFGVQNPRPENTNFPSQHFQTVHLQSNKKIELWEIENNVYPQDSVKGVVAIFHGYSGCKSKMIDKSNEFIALGYHTILVDFMGSGGSEDCQTTIGYLESQQVKTVYDFIHRKYTNKKIILMGTSMGAVAIMKSIHDYRYQPSQIILECPFGSMYETVASRFQVMNVPTIPMAGLLVFWGGVINGFWAFHHNPSHYALSIKCPTLLLYGEKDRNVHIDETKLIYQNLSATKKKLKTFPNAGHENYLTHYKKEWITAVKQFLL